MVKEPVAVSRDVQHEGLTRRKFIGAGAMVSLGFCSSGVEPRGMLKTLVFVGDAMSAHRDSPQKTHLKWDVFVTPSIPVVTNDLAPGEHERPWPPISSTLIYGSRDAVAVDSFITEKQARAQADWIASTGKNLTTIYATHGHGDHFSGPASFWSASRRRASWPLQAPWK